MTMEERDKSRRHKIVRDTYAGEEITLAELWRTIVEGRWIFIAVIVIVTGLAAAAAYIMTPVYQGEVLLAARGDEEFGATLGGQLGDLASLAGVELGSGGGERTKAVAMLRSRALAEQFIRENKLLHVLFAEHWDSTNQRWMIDDPADTPTMREAVRKFNDSIRSVAEDPGTGLVTLAMQWKDPVLAAEWANRFVDMLNAEMRQRAIAEAEESIAYLQEEANKTNVVELERVIYSLIEEQIQAIMLANVREEFAFEILDPAIVPELDELVWPKRALMIIVGFILGAMLGLFGVFVRDARRSPQSGRED